jgi:hypothetical protein
MRRAFAFLLALLGLAGGATSAEACRIRLPGVIPISLARTPSEAVVLAEVVSADAYSAEVRVDTIFDGRTEERTTRLAWDARAGRPDGEVIITSCGPPGPPVAPGDRVVVVLIRHQGRQAPAGWLTLAEAGRLDDFFPMFLAERRPAARRRLLDRWRLVTRSGGPVPVGDPRHWFAPDAGDLGLRAWGDDITRAEFELDAEGRVASCRTQQTRPPAPRDASVCAGLRAHRFLPPIFQRERAGWFEVRWRGAAPPAQ